MIRYVKEATRRPGRTRTMAGAMVAVVMAGGCASVTGDARDVAASGSVAAGEAYDSATRHDDAFNRHAHLDYPLPGPALPAAQYRTFSWHMAFHTQPRIPEAVVNDNVHEYLNLFYPQVAYRGTAFGGPGAESPFSADEVDEYARTYRRAQVLTGGFALYRTLDQDERDNTAAAPMRAPTLVMTAEGQAAFIRKTLQPRMSAIVRAVDVPRSGHWLPEENPTFVTSELLAFFAA
jgi:pimeloyl-ACP methyl ester carboxylesterase